MESSRGKEYARKRLQLQGHTLKAEIKLGAAVQRRGVIYSIGATSLDSNITLIMAPSVFWALQCIPSNQGGFATGESALHRVLQDDIPTRSSVMQVCWDKAG